MGIFIEFAFIIRPNSPTERFLLMKSKDANHRKYAQFDVSTTNRKRTFSEQL